MCAGAPFPGVIENLIVCGIVHDIGPGGPEAFDDHSCTSASVQGEGISWVEMFRKEACQFGSIHSVCKASPASVHSHKVNVVVAAQGYCRAGMAHVLVTQRVFIMDFLNL